MHTKSIADGRVIRGAIFGCGQVAQYHLTAYQAIEGVQIVALANRTVEKARAFAQAFGISQEHVYATHNELLEQEHLDFVDVATAPGVHLEQVLAAVAHGCHVLCQKPFAENLQQAQTMIKAAEEGKVLLSINENWRWRSWYREIKKIIDAGKIGKPNYCYIKRHNNGTLPTRDGKPPVLLEKQPYTQELERLLLFEWGIHMIDVSRFLFGECERLQAFTQRVSGYFKGEDRAIVNMRFPQVDVLADLSWATIAADEDVSQLEEIIIEGESGTIRLTPESEQISIQTQAGVTNLPAMKADAGTEYQLSYTRAIEHFINCLRDGSLPETNARNNFRTLACLFAAYESAAINEVVEMEKFNLEVED